MKTLKVYGWQAFQPACPPAGNGSKQTRQICAASSQREVARIVGVRSVSSLFNLTETGNAGECKAAMLQPRTVLWQPIDIRYAYRHIWFTVDATREQVAAQLAVIPPT
jgi:hypothetical protein